MESVDLAIGNVLRLDAAIGEIRADLYVVIERGTLFTISRLGENEDGDPCTTCRTHIVTFREITQFVPMHLIIEPPLADFGFNG